MRSTILHVVTGLSTGGAEKALFNLLNGGLADRFDSHVISLSSLGTIGPEISALGIPVTALEMRGRFPTFAAMRKLRSVIRDFRPTVVQGWMYHGNLAANVVRTMAQDRPIVSWNIRHSLSQLGYEKPLTRQVIRANRMLSKFADIILYNSQLSRKQHEGFGFASGNGKVIPNGIDLRQFSFCAEIRANVRSSLRIPTDAFVVGHVGRLHPMKDHPLFLRAASCLAQRYPQMHILLCGRGVSLKDEALKQLIPDFLRGRFHLLGERGDVAELMNAMDVHCVSSAWGEAFPNVIGEAMATGVPCVTTDVGDSSAIIGDTGAVVPPRDENALVAEIERFLTMPLDKRRESRVNARVRIENHFSLQRSVIRYTDLYQGLIRKVRV